jgi:hypothetical protein
VVYDIDNDSPIYNKVEINGRVSFLDNGVDRNLRARYIFVRQGELTIGNSTFPYLSNATITLYGDKEDEAFVVTNDVEGGNKILVNTALINMQGIPRRHRTRLLKTVNINDT